MKDIGHAEKCTGELCAPDCGWDRFHRQLDAPLMPWEVREQERVQERWRELLAGRIPA